MKIMASLLLLATLPCIAQPRPASGAFNPLDSTTENLVVFSETPDTLSHSPTVPTRAFNSVKPSLFKVEAATFEVAGRHAN